MRLDTRWEMASSKSAITKLLENMEGTAACKQAERFLRPVDLQIVALFLRGRQNFIQLFQGIQAPKLQVLKVKKIKVSSSVPLHIW